MTENEREILIPRRGFLAATIAAAAGGLACAQQANEKKVDPLDLPLDKPGVWTLNFRYKPPRIATLDGFDKEGKPAKQTVWYMWYQVYNKTAEPVYFIPEFELVTKDLNTNHLDEPQPYLLEQIRAIEDSAKVLNLLSTIDISKRPIPITKPDSIPRAVSGVAIWTDLQQKAPKTNRFSVYIAGLSNGLSTEQTSTGDTLIKRKTLQINFLRPTDDNRPAITDIVPDDANGPAESWIYRSVSTSKTPAKKDE